MYCNQLRNGFRLAGILIFISCFVSALNAQSSVNKPKHVLLITIDGLRPEFYLDSTWGMHNLRQLMFEGVAARGVNPVFPSVTYPDHTTMITGVKPSTHGIFFNSPFRPDGSKGQGYVYYDSIRTETLFDAMKNAGKTTANVIWPVTVNAPIDYNIPDIAEAGNRDRRGITAKYVHPAGLWKVLQDSATGFLDTLDWNMFNDEVAFDENIGQMGAYLLKTYKPGFTAVHFATTDHAQHEHGREHFQVRSAVAAVDRGIRDLLEALGRAGMRESTLIVVTGDHGFEDVTRSVEPNVLLTKAGLLNNKQTGDWKAQFYSSGGGSFLYLKNTNDKSTLEKVKALLKTVPDSISKTYKILDQSTLIAAGAAPGSVLALASSDGTTFGNTLTGELVRVLPSVKGTHGNYPDHAAIRTGFVAAGPGLAKGVVIPQMDLLDIAPLIIHITGLPFHKMEGVLREELLSH